MIVIYGYSDDLVYVDGPPDGNCGPNDTHHELSARRAVITLGTRAAGGICVEMAYNSSSMVNGLPDGQGCWSAKIVQLNSDGTPIPWDTRIRHGVKFNGDVGYSVRVEVDAPDNVPISIHTIRHNGELRDYFNEAA